MFRTGLSRTATGLLRLLTHKQHTCITLDWQLHRTTQFNQYKVYSRPAAKHVLSTDNVSQNTSGEPLQNEATESSPHVEFTDKNLLSANPGTSPVASSQIPFDMTDNEREKVLQKIDELLESSKKTSNSGLVSVDVRASPTRDYITIHHRGRIRTMRISECQKELFKNGLSKVPVESPPDKLDIRKLKEYYLGLSKVRLTGLVVTTSMFGYMLAPCPFILSSFLSVSAGTFLTSAAANTMNQVLEYPFDSQMNRTQNRVLVKRRITPLHAMTFASVCGVSGLTLLTLGCNPLTGALGLTTLVLYTAVYTPMKRYSIYNTWVGSVVGAIPPMMGWAACTGALEPGAWLVGAVLFAWQFPHFFGLSWNLRADYAKAGYCMTSVMDPDMCRRVSLRYCVILTALSFAAPDISLHHWLCASSSLLVNLPLVWFGWRFYRDGDSKSSRKLFMYTLIHLPLVFAILWMGTVDWEYYIAMIKTKFVTGPVTTNNVSSAKAL